MEKLMGKYDEVENTFYLPNNNGFGKWLTCKNMKYIL
jgi:hypothetical protein